MTTILVIDDETSVLRNVSEMLTFEGYDVLTAEDGLRGIAVALARKPDLVVCDIIMPLVSGFAVLRDLRANAETAHIPILFITGTYRRSALMPYLGHERVDCLFKPFTANQLLAAVGRHFVFP